MKVVYIRFVKGTPSYVGEGSFERSQDLSPRNSFHKRFLEKHKVTHECSVVVSRHSDKVGSVLQEQGFIRWFGRRKTKSGPLTNILPFGDLGNGGKLPEDVETKRRQKIGETCRQNFKTGTQFENHGEKVSTGKTSSFHKKFGGLSRIVQSWWLRSREFPSPLPESNNRQHPELSHKVLQLLMKKEFPISILRRLRKGEDFGGKLEDVTHMEFETEWKRVKQGHSRVPRHFEKNVSKNNPNKHKTLKET